MAYYRTQYGFKTPSQVTWIGKGLDVGASANGFGIPIMQSKTQQEDFVYAGYHLSNNQLYKIIDNLSEESDESKSTSTLLNERFDNFKRKNQKLITNSALLPDSVYQNFFNN